MGPVLIIEIPGGVVHSDPERAVPGSVQAIGHRGFAEGQPSAAASALHLDYVFIAQHHLIVAVFGHYFHQFRSRNAELPAYIFHGTAFFQFVKSGVGIIRSKSL